LIRSHALKCARNERQERTQLTSLHFTSLHCIRFEWIEADSAGPIQASQPAGLAGKAKAQEEERPLYKRKVATAASCQEAEPLTRREQDGGQELERKEKAKLIQCANKEGKYRLQHNQ
jgi:hypothetical protein